MTNQPINPSFKISRWLIFLLLALFASSACDRAEIGKDIDIRKLEKERMEKDFFLKNARQSPLKANQKAAFHGLHYFPPNEQFKFSGPIERLRETIVDTILTTHSNDLRPALRYGYFNFEHEGQQHRLLVYKFIRKNPALSRQLFLGFTDETTEKETYSAGRYIDLIENNQNYYTIDFNTAYNPFCAYNEDYACPIPPMENHLPFAVRAGEKDFK